ncbi:AAA family ATPase [Corynebacterium parakroppenstedtii]|uniref:AAA family ATPase n=1 Tax=Corynebacterium parakroppenstedtii TaxID=2828363 RepID=UPI0030EB6F02
MLSSGTNDDKKNIRNFRLDYQSRVDFVLNYGGDDADPRIIELLRPFVSWYKDESEFNFEKAEEVRSELSKYLVAQYPEQFSGIEDPLLGVARTIDGDTMGEGIARPKTTQSDRPLNLISFGAPGTGKSYGLAKRAKVAFGDNVERVTFYADYTYGQFVGTYKPTVQEDEGVTYAFVPGPFLRVLVEAMKSQKRGDKQEYLLLIEEMNRAMPSAVFGDMFQLLDRDENGDSQYKVVTSEDLRRFLCKELGSNEREVRSIGIPPNMHIWATMNSADQGVLPVDTAFKRRWDFEYVGSTRTRKKSMMFR